MPLSTLKKQLPSLCRAAALGLALSASASFWVGFSLASEQVLHPLPFGQADVRFHGEMAQKSYQIYLSADMTNSPVTFQIAPTSAISVMPEASWMRIEMNGHPLQPVRLGTDGAPRLHQRIVGPQMLQPGWNTVHLAVDQRHRVDCSFPATFELWSDLDAVSTGFLVGAQSAANATPTVSDLLSFPLNSAGRLALHGVVSPGADEAMVQGLADALAALALALGAGAPQVSIGHEQQAASINVHLDGVQGVLPGRYALTHNGQGMDAKALDITLGGTQAEHWRTASSLLASELTPFATTQRDVAVRTIEGPDRFTLADIGLTSREFAGRHFEQSFVLDLPYDFFASDVGRAEIRLAGGYTDGLAENSELSLHVNGTIAASISLDSRGGEVFSNRPLYVDLGHFRPGRNEVSIVANVTHRDDSACGLAALTGAQPRFLLLDETEVSFPSFARLGQFPQLAPGLGHGLLGANATTHIFVPHPDIATLSAAVALRVQMALDIGRLGVVDLRFEAPQDSEVARRGDNSILVAALQDLPDQIAGLVDIPIQEMTLAWAPMTIAPDMMMGDPILTASTTNTTAPMALPGRQPLPPAVGQTPSTPMAWSNDPVQQRLSILRQELAQPAFQGQAQRMMQAPGIAQTQRMAPAPVFTDSIGNIITTDPQAAPGAGLDANGLIPAPLRDAELRARWEDTMNKSPDLLRTAGALGQRLQDYVVDLVGERHYAPDISPEADLVIQQMATSPWTNGPLTLITASEPARLEAGMHAISEPRHWSELGGSRAVFSAREGHVDVSTGLSQAHYVVTQPTSISNWRLVLAGYYSNNPVLYTLAILLIAPGLGIVCGRAIRRSGQVQFDRDAQPSEQSAGASSA